MDHPRLRDMLPSREAAIRNNWRFQVQWIEDGKPCFTRFNDGHLADGFADKLRKTGIKEFWVIDLTDALQLH